MWSVTKSLLWLTENSSFLARIRNLFLNLYVNIKISRVKLHIKNDPRVNSKYSEVHTVDQWSPTGRIWPNEPSNPSTELKTLWGSKTNIVWSLLLKQMKNNQDLNNYQYRKHQIIMLDKHFILFECPTQKKSRPLTNITAVGLFCCISWSAAQYRL